MSTSIKKRFLELLDKDEEFRLAVAAKLGLLDKLNSLQQSVDNLTAEVKALREGQEKLWQSVEKLWQNVEKLWQNVEKLWQEVKTLREGQEKLWQEVKTLREGQEKLWQNVEKLWQEVKTLREGQEDIVREQRRMSRAIGDIGTTLERLTLSLEDEASEVVGFNLRGKLGVDFKFTRIFADSKEVDLYASQGDVWVIVEAATRLGVKLVNEVNRKADIIRHRKPELVKPRFIKAVYTLVPLNDAVEEAKKQGVWVLTWKEELTPLVIHTTNTSNLPT